MQAYFPRLFGVSSELGVYNESDKESTTKIPTTKSKQRALNDWEKKWADTYFFMREVASIADLQSMSWVRFFHLHEQHSELIESQIRLLNNK